MPGEKRGARVLEIGSGGCNAEIVGPEGLVVTVDIFSVKSSVLNF
jgi:hypothetical protein